MAIIALPILFTAGMTTMDTIDGIFMSKAYGWAFVTPVRKIYYNITMTSLSIFVAVVIGSVQLLSLLGDEFGLSGQPWEFLASINLNLAGQIVVGTFFVVWISALVYYKVAKVDQKFAAAQTRDH